MFLTLVSTTFVHIFSNLAFVFFFSHFVKCLRTFRQLYFSYNRCFFFFFFDLVLVSEALLYYLIFHSYEMHRK